MNLFRKLAVAILVISFLLGATTTVVAAKMNNESNILRNENSSAESLGFSFAYSSGNLENAKIEYTYEDYYTTYGSAKANDTILEELYISINGTLTYALRDSSRKSYSFSQAWSSSKESGSDFENVFKQTDEEGNTVNYYNEVYQFYRANKNADGYAQVTEDIIPALKHIAAKLNTLQSEDSWPALCYYKRMDTTGLANPYENDELLGEKKLVYGDTSLSDEDAFVLLVMGDGFTASEQNKFYEKAEEFALYLMDTDPFSEFPDTIKIYAMSVDSSDSGVSRDTESYTDASNDIKDTYFETGFWCGGMQRLISVSSLGLLKLNSIMRYDMPYADFAGLLINSERYGGSGGTYCTCSLNESAKEIFIHEIAHTIADLADEYYAGNSYFGTHPNMTNQKKIENLPWADFYGLDGVGKYAYVDDLTEEVISYGGTNWYKPCDKTCKMEILWDLQEDGTQVPVPFCAVCSEALRVSICRYSNVTKIFYQPYNRQFKDDGQAYKLSDPLNGFSYNILDYVFLRRGDKSVALSELDSSLLQVVILNENDNSVESTTAIGTYSVSVSFLGNSTFDAMDISFTFSVTSVKKEKGFIGCVDDILATKDLRERFDLINEALELYETVNKEDASVMSAKASLDQIIIEFNETVEEMNSDSMASISILYNCISTFMATIVMSCILWYIIQKAAGVLS